MVFLPRVVQTKRFREGSQPFKVTITDLVASAKKIYGFDSEVDIRKFLPLNYLRIINKGGTTLKIYIGQSMSRDEEVILDDTIYTHFGEFYSFELENLDTSTTATGAKIYTTVQRKAGGR